MSRRVSSALSESSLSSPGSSSLPDRRTNRESPMAASLLARSEVNSPDPKQRPHWSRHTEHYSFGQVCQLIRFVFWSILLEVDRSSTISPCLRSSAGG